MKVLKILFFAFLCFSTVNIASSCLSYSEYINDRLSTWVGQSKVDLLQRFGAPIRTFDDGNGGSIWVFQGPYPLLKYNFLIDKDGIIYKAFESQ